MKSVIIVLISIILTTFACSNQNKAHRFTNIDIDSLKTEFKNICQTKDSSFKYADWSPLNPEDKQNFSKLHYFEYDISFRYELKIQIYSNQDTIEVPGSKPGDLRKAIRYGYFEFKRNNRTHRLEVLKFMPRKEGMEAYLFVGFWDATSGDETYPGGRYLDIKEIESDVFLVDFNYAYNPYCAYNDRYSCLIPPLENRLLYAMTCGEKTYRKH